jgi:hypothetical protein
VPADDDQVGTVDGCSVGAAVPWSEGEGVVGVAFGRVEVTHGAVKLASRIPLVRSMLGSPRSWAACCAEQVGGQRSDMYAQSRGGELEGGDGIDR